MKKILTAILAATLVFSLSGCRAIFTTLDNVEFEEFYDDNLAEHVDIISSQINDFDPEEFRDKYYNDDDDYSNEASSETSDTKSQSAYVNSDSIDTPWIILNDGMPDFTDDELSITSLEEYSPLDELGRCGTAMAVITPDTMPVEERGNIGMIKPTGWHTVKYDCVDGKYLYNRCHLIGYQLAGENANELNLITGTRYLNIEGMLDFENDIADYVEETGNSVLYRVTPVYDGDNLLCDGVQMEAYSIEDNGMGICFNIFAYNIQPGVEINYATGESRLAE